MGDAGSQYTKGSHFTLLGKVALHLPVLLDHVGHSVEMGSQFAQLILTIDLHAQFQTTGFHPPDHADHGMDRLSERRGGGKNQTD